MDQRAVTMVGRVGGPGGGRLPASVLRAEAAARPAAGLFRGVPAARMRCGVVRDDQQLTERRRQGGMGKFGSAALWGRARRGLGGLRGR